MATEGHAHLVREGVEQGDNGSYGGPHAPSIQKQPFVVRLVAVVITTYSRDAGTKALHIYEDQTLHSRTKPHLHDCSDGG